jgi:anaphase-promoting complex subunit 1
VSSPNNPESYSIAYLPPNAACVGQLDKAALESAIVVVLLSLSMVLAGSGHLPTFRLIQMLSRRAAAPLRPPGQSAAAPEGQPGGPIAAILGGAGVGTNSLNYGHHLAVSLAAGLLFLSGGRSSLSTSNEAIAALLIALYPVWPCTPTDQRCHLQVRRIAHAVLRCAVAGRKSTGCNQMGSTTIHALGAR